MKEAGYFDMDTSKERVKRDYLGGCKKWGWMEEDRDNRQEEDGKRE